MKSGSYLRRLLLLLANSSTALKKDSKVESSNRKKSRKETTTHWKKSHISKNIENIKDIEWRVLFYTGKYMGGKKAWKTKWLDFFM